MTEWPNDGDFESLAMERTIHPEMSHEDLAQHIFEENAAMAAQSIVTLAAGSTNERVRLSASVYVVERILGKAPVSPSTVKAPWEKLLASTIVDVETYANGK